ncbi:MAG: aquaporin [Micrococcales bacterium]|nr:aquaporin [Micrococcales bacterium]
MAAQQSDHTPAPFAAPGGPFADPDELAELDDEEEEIEPYGEPRAAGPGLLARVGAELFGTFILVFAGVGTVLYGQYTDVGGSLAVAGAFGIAWVITLATIGRISGGHANPAVTLGAAISGRLSWADLLPYWLAQLVGGALASAVLFLTIPTGLGQLLGKSADKRDMLGGAANGFGPHSPLAHLLASQSVTSTVTFSLGAALLVEAVATAVLVGVFLAVTKREVAGPRTPFVLGMTLAVLMMVTLPITNAGLNPARSTAVAILSPSWALAQLWLFWVAPLLGAALAALLYRAFSSPLPLLGGDPDDEDDDFDDETDGSDGSDDEEGETVPVIRT